MTTTATQERPVEGPPSPRRGKNPTPPGHRVLHLVIDQGTFDLIHMCALRSRMKFTAYMQRFLREAFPYEAPEAPTAVGVGAATISEGSVPVNPTVPSPPGP